MGKNRLCVLCAILAGCAAAFFMGHNCLGVLGAILAGFALAGEFLVIFRA